MAAEDALQILKEISKSYLVQLQKTGMGDQITDLPGRKKQCTLRAKRSRYILSVMFESEVELYDLGQVDFKTLTQKLITSGKRYRKFT